MRLGEVARNDMPRPARLELTEPERDLPFVLVTQEALADMYEHADRGFPVEIAGYALGLPLIDVDSERLCTYIERVVPAQCESTRTHVTLLPSGLNQVQQISDSTGTILVGYYHSHPGFSVFQSGEDLRTYGDYYPEPYQIAIVVDSTRTDSTSIDLDGTWIGFFGWDVGKSSQRLPAKHVLLAERIEGPIIPGSLLANAQSPLPNRHEEMYESAIKNRPELQPSGASGIRFSLEIDFKVGGRAWSKSLRGTFPTTRRLSGRDQI